MPEPGETGATGGDAAAADALRPALVDQLRELGAIRTERVADVFRAVTRHVFLPGVPLEVAHANDAVVTKRDERGVALSSVSAPQLVAMMLEQLRVEPGHHVLEIGSGGYNAALLAELVGPDGSVTTVDIDPEVVDRARSTLAAAGYPQVRALCADGEFGAAEYAPFDRIVVTVGAADIPPAWVEQLAERGRLVVPLRLRGLTRSIAFETGGGRLVSQEYEQCGFVPMQGAGQDRERLVRLYGDEVGLRVDDGQPVDEAGLRQALSAPRVQVWSQVTAGTGERLDGLHLWLAVCLPAFGLLAATQQAVDRQIVAHAWPVGVPSTFDGASLAYLTLRPTGPGRQRFEFGAYGHGPGGGKLAEAMVEHIRSWDGSSLDAGIEAYPAGAPGGTLPAGALVLSKRHTRVVVSWPSSRDRPRPGVR
jgi:protein-L-isoaspartate(D-aspartate) O-methyltransferase